MLGINHSHVYNDYSHSNYQNKPIIVFDLDETLVYGLPLPPNSSHHPIKVGRHRMFIKIRPGTHELIEKISPFFEIFFFTSAKKEYADQIINLIAPKTKETNRLFRESCTQFNGYLVKDLRIFGDSLNNVILIDDLSSSGLFQPFNHIRISAWMGEESDSALLNELLPFLDNFKNKNNILDLLPQLSNQKTFNSLFFPLPN